MPEAFGQFVVVRKLSRHALGETYLARREGEEALVVTCRPPVDVVGAESAARLVGEFRASHEAQRGLAGAGSSAGGAAEANAGGWARVYEIGDAPGRAVGEEMNAEAGAALPGAYAAIEAPARPLMSVADLARMRVSVDAGTARRWLGEIARTLAGAKKSGGRGHGRLSGERVLLVRRDSERAQRAARADEPPVAPSGIDESAGDIDALVPVLTEPKAEWERADEERDVRAFAEIAHLLIAHEAHRGGWSGGAKNYAELGPFGAGLRKLVDSILDPSASSGDGRVAGIAIEDLPAQIDKLGAAGKQKRMVLAGIAAVIVLAAGIGGFMYYRHAENVRKGRIVQKWLESPVHAEKWKEFTTEYRDWFATFVQRLDEEPAAAVKEAVAAEGGAGQNIRTRRDLYALDADLAKVVTLLRAEGISPPVRDPDDPKDPWTIAGVSPTTDLGTLGTNPTESAKQDASIRATERMLATMAQTREGLLGWKGSEAIAGAADEFASRGWTNGEAYLRELAARLGEGAGAAAGNLSVDVAGDIDAAVSVRPRVEAIRAKWGELEALSAQLRGADGDPVLAKFGDVVVARMRAADAESAGQRSRGLVKLSQELDRLKELGARVAAFLENDVKRVDLESFRESAEYREMAGASSPSQEVIERWMAVARQHPTLDPALDPRKEDVWPAPARIAKIDELAEELAQPPLEAPVDAAMRERIARLKGDAAAVRNLSWSRKREQEVRTGATRVAQEAGDVAGRLLELRAERLAEVTRQGEAARAELSASASPVPGSGAITLAWERERARILAEFEPVEFKRMNHEAAEVRTLLALPHETFAGAWTEAESALLAPVTHEEREQRIGELLSSGALEAGRRGEFGARASEAAGGYRAWLDALSSLRERIAVIERELAGLGPMSGESEAARANAKLHENASLMDDARVAAAVVPVLRRLELVQKLETTAGEEERVEAVKSGDAPAVRVAAFRGLAASRYPTTEAGAAAVPDLLVKVREAVGGVPDAARRGELERALLRDAPAAMIARYCLSRPTGEEAERSLAHVKALGIEESSLPEALRFNLALGRAREALAAPGLDDLTAWRAARKFLDEARALPGASGVPAASGALAQATELTRVQPEEVKRIDPTTLGPGSAAGGGGWTGTEDFQTGRLTFTRSDGTRNGKVTLVFERIEGEASTGGEPFYLMANEVSFRVVQGLLDNDARRAQFMATLPVFEEDDPSWIGPRVWRRGQGTGRAALLVNESWIYVDPNITEDMPAYAPGLLTRGEFAKIADEHGGEPSSDHPMQRVSPTGALVLARIAGCRLPTSAEWRAAYRGSGARGGNLRDRTFELQRAHVEAMQAGVQRKSSFQWPDADIAPVDEAGGAPKGPRAQAGPGDDGVLWFLKVDADGSGSALKHFVGNVAEYVLDDAAAMESAPPTAAGARDAIRRTPGALKIAGGSALSPPGVPVDEPRAVDLIAAADGFTDVGVRFAFGASGTAKGESLASKLLKVLSPGVYAMGR